MILNFFELYPTVFLFYHFLPHSILFYLNLSWAIPGFCRPFQVNRLQPEITWDNLRKPKVPRELYQAVFSFYLGLPPSISDFLWLSPAISGYIRPSLARVLHTVFCVTVTDNLSYTIKPLPLHWSGLRMNSMVFQSYWLVVNTCDLWQTRHSYVNVNTRLIECTGHCCAEIFTKIVDFRYKRI